MITQTFDLNLIPNSAPVVVHVDQYDHGTGRLIAKLYNGSTAYTPAAGATAMVQGTKPDKHGFDYNATISGNTVTMDLTEQMSIVAGRVCVQVVITEGSTRTGSFVFFLDVQPSALPADTDLSASDYQLVEDLLEEAQAINTHFPYIGANGNWWYWDKDAGAYVDSGVDASITITIGQTSTLPAGSSATVTNTGTSTDPIFNFGIPKGDTGATGATGNGIVSITKTGTSGLVDTYTITYTNGNTSTFTVTNGADGSGSVSSVNNIAPIGGNVSLNMEDIPIGAATWAQIEQILS